jgi:hypothetical protein
MLLDLKLRTLYTNQGVLLKTLNCDRKIEWGDLSPNIDNPNHTCRHCKKTIHETVALSEDEVSALLMRDPSACLLVNPNQWNITLVSEK